jgi:DNA (cytosine-5)-methyltransferase 1
MKHLDLFSGIGGFAYAADQVWDNLEHVFCDNNRFCQRVIEKHWKGSKIYNDIRDIKDEQADILTGGFPCQPFSQVGKRKGTADDRYLWPEMLRVIRLSKPKWVIAENVGGLLTVQNGLVFEQVCTDLEDSGYEVQPFIIPAAGVSAPHKRDRIWICAYANSSKHKPQEHRRANSKTNSLQSQERQTLYPWRSGGTSDSSDWIKAATELCGVDNGLPNRVDRLKSLGNGIVPQIAVEIMKGLR